MWTSWWSAPTNAPFTSSLTLCWMKKTQARPIGAIQRKPSRKGSAWVAERTGVTTWATRSIRSEPKEAARCTWRRVPRCPTKVGWKCCNSENLFGPAFFFYYPYYITHMGSVHCNRDNEMMLLNPEPSLVFLLVERGLHWPTLLKLPMFTASKAQCTALTTRYSHPASTLCNCDHQHEPAH